MLQKCNLTEKAFPNDDEMKVKDTNDGKMSLKLLDFRDNMVEDKISVSSYEYLKNVVVLIDNQKPYFPNPPEAPLIKVRSVNESIFAESE